jgi:hypothetical protein
MSTITDCPMCNSPIPAAEMESIRTCGSCGADLTRWKPRSSRPPEPPASDRMARADVAEAASAPGLGLGVVGALAGAVTGAAVMLGFYKAVGFRFPLLGVGIGLLTGFWREVPLQRNRQHFGNCCGSGLADCRGGNFISDVRRISDAEYHLGCGQCQCRIPDCFRLAAPEFVLKILCPPPQRGD